MKNVFYPMAVLWLFALLCLTGCGGGVGYAPTSSSYAIQRLIGCSIIANDGQFLGIISSNTYDANSIMNRYGSYGSSYSATSIFNKNGNYGSTYSALSPFNTYTTTPPIIYRGTTPVAYLTINTMLSPRIDPYTMIGALSR